MERVLGCLDEDATGAVNVVLEVLTESEGKGIESASGSA